MMFVDGGSVTGGVRTKIGLHGGGRWWLCEAKKARRLRRRVETFGQWVDGLDDADGAGCDLR